MLLVDPVAVRLVRRAARYPWITPNRLTLTAFGLGLGAAACFAQGSRWWLVAGAVAYHLSFVVDCMDGKLARLMGTGSVFGVWLDFVFDRLLVVICTIALMGGQYARTGRAEFLVLGGAVVFLNLFRHVNGQTMQAARQQMHQQLLAVRDSTGGDEPAVPDSFAQLSGGAKARLGALLRLRDVLARHRIRADLISGIEFQMAVFVIGPLLGLIIPTTIVAGCLLLAFELAMIFQFWLATRAFNRRLGALRQAKVTALLPTQTAPAHAGDAQPTTPAIPAPRSRSASAKG